MTSPRSSNTPASDRWFGVLRRVAHNPVTVSCALAFLLAEGAIWILSERTVLREAREKLLAAAEDMSETVGTCADNLLFYQGNAIVGHFRRPEAMTVDTVQELMDRYGLDELNVVSRDGIVLAGALADVGYDMGSNPMTAPFNCLLAGAKTYSQDFRAPIENPTGEKRKYAGVAFPWPEKGYIQMGFSESRLRHGIDFWFEDAAIDWHVSSKGYFIIADEETGDVLSCGRRAEESGSSVISRGVTLEQIGLKASMFPKNPKTFFTAPIFCEKCLCLTFMRCYHRIICVIPFSEINGDVLESVLLSGSVLLAVFVIVVIFMTKLTGLVSSLREKEREERERQLRDLSLAKTIQTSSLPSVFPQEEAYSIFARMDTAREVGGDFYDFYTLPSGRILFLVADVSGKGVPAALFMMRAKAIVRAAVFGKAPDLSSAVAEVNDALAEKNGAEMFITAWIGICDLRTGEVEFINAGHNPPLVKHADGSVSWLRERGGLVLAAMGGVRYRTSRFVLRPGDSLCLYTDGVTEAMNPHGAQYGEDRLEARLRESGREYIDEIRRDVQAFADGAEQSDDITMLAFDFKKTQA